MRRKLFNRYSKDFPRILRHYAKIQNLQISDIVDLAIQRAWEKKEEFRIEISKTVRTTRDARVRRETAPLGTSISDESYRLLKRMSRQSRRRVAEVVEKALWIYFRAPGNTFSTSRNAESAVSPALPILSLPVDFPSNPDAPSGLTTIKETRAVLFDWTTIFAAMFSLNTRKLPTPISDHCGMLVAKCASYMSRGYISATSAARLAQIVEGLAPNPEGEFFEGTVRAQIGQAFKAETAKRLGMLFDSEITVLPVEPQDLIEAGKSLGEHPLAVSIDIAVGHRILGSQFVVATTRDDFDRIAAKPESRFIVVKPRDIQRPVETPAEVPRIDNAVTPLSKGSRTRISPNRTARRDLGQVHLDFGVEATEEADNCPF